jgi:Cu/Ag efflux pump CusA
LAVTRWVVRLTRSGSPAMLRQILGFSLQFCSLVLAVAAAVVLFGVLRLRDAQVDVLPEFAASTVEIQT